MNSSRTLPYCAVFVAGLALASSVTPLNAQTVAAPKPTGETIQVSGMLMTNFLNPTNTLGTATGDLRGAIAATLLEFDQATGRGRVQHEWVTEAGDRLFFVPLEFKAAPAAADPALGLFHVYYPAADAIVGGTGKFEGATGRFTTSGSADFVMGQTVFRYSGTITLKAPTTPASPALSGAEVRAGEFRFQVQAPAAHQVTAETSENLKEWQTLAAKPPVNGAADFSDAAPATQPQRFYRAKGE